MADLEIEEKLEQFFEGIDDRTPISLLPLSATNGEEIEAEEQEEDSAGVDEKNADDTRSIDEGELLTPPEPPVRRSSRVHQPTTRYSVSDYVLITDEGEIESFQEAMTCKNKHEWMKAM